MSALLSGNREYFIVTVDVTETREIRVLAKSEDEACALVIQGGWPEKYKVIDEKDFEITDVRKQDD